MINTGFYFFLATTIIILMFYRILRIELFEPISIIIILHILLPFVIYPLLIASSQDSLLEFIKYFNEKGSVFIILFVIVFFWFIGMSFTKSKTKYTIIRSNYVKPDIEFATILFVLGTTLYFLTFKFAGLNFLSSFQNPLATRYQIINTTGGYHLRNISLWSIWTGWFLIFISYLHGQRVRLWKLILSFLFVIIICIPLGQRYQLIFPIIFLILALKYHNRISTKTIYVSFSILIILLPTLAIYRELGNSKEGIVSFTVIFENITELFKNRKIFLNIIAERFESIKWFQTFWESKNEIKLSFFDSVSNLFKMFLPASFTGGVKASDVEVLLTLHFLGSQKFGTFSFTSFPEWYLNFGLLGFPIMSFVSGILAGLITKNIKKIGFSIFALVLFADGFFLKLPFLNFNFSSNVSIIYHLIFALFISTLHKLFRFYLRWQKCSI